MAVHGWTRIKKTATQSKDSSSPSSICVNPRSSAVEKYSDFSPSITHRRDLAAIVQSDPALAFAHAGLHKTLAQWWQKNLPHVIALAPDGGKKGNVDELAAAADD
jgi:hypothetical protein